VESNQCVLAGNFIYIQAARDAGLQRTYNVTLRVSSSRAPTTYTTVTSRVVVPVNPWVGCVPGTLTAIPGVPRTQRRATLDDGQAPEEQQQQAHQASGGLAEGLGLPLLEDRPHWTFSRGGSEGARSHRAARGRTDASRK